MKILSGGVVLLALIAFGAVWFSQPAAGPDGSWESALIRQQKHDIELDLLKTQRDTFAAMLADVADDLQDERTNLAKATQHVVAFAESFYPVFLEHLVVLEEGADTKERVARNLLRQLRNDIDSPATSERLAHLEHELDMILHSAHPPVAEH
jgi:hypothetical protein